MELPLQWQRDRSSKAKIDGNIRRLDSVFLAPPVVALRALSGYGAVSEQPYPKHRQIHIELGTAIARSAFIEDCQNFQQRSNDRFRAQASRWVPELLEPEWKSIQITESLLDNSLLKRRYRVAMVFVAGGGATTATILRMKPSLLLRT